MTPRPPGAIQLAGGEGVPYTGWQLPHRLRHRRRRLRCTRSRRWAPRRRLQVTAIYMHTRQRHPPRVGAWSSRSPVRQRHTGQTPKDRRVPIMLDSVKLGYSEPDRPPNRDALARRFSGRLPVRDAHAPYSSRKSAMSIRVTVPSGCKPWISRPGTHTVPSSSAVACR